MKIKLSITLAALAAILVSQTSVVAQGSLTPPGPPGPTMKTLEQVEPRIDLQNAPASVVDTNNVNHHFIINQPGSYYLSANLGVTKPNGIQINAAGVTLDLNGFEISRTSGSGDYGIEISGTSDRVTVRNGSIKGFGSGILSAGAVRFPRGCHFRDLAVSNCTTYGIYAGEAAVLESCRAHDNTGTAALRAAAGSTFVNCTASENTASYAFSAGNGSVLMSCNAFSNTADTAIYANSGSTLLNCAAYDNTAVYAIYAGGASTLSNCSAFSNQSDATVSAGFVTGNGAVIVHCTAGSQNSTAGVSTSSTGMGFYVGAKSTIENCTAVFNEGDGIRLSIDSLARTNSSVSNGYFGGDGAGVRATGGSNRIEGNHVSNNDRGIDVDVAGNVIVKNTASGNGTNYELAANNVFGAIVDRTAPASAAVSGNSAVSSAGTADPWANISY